MSTTNNGRIKGLLQVQRMGGDVWRCSPVVHDSTLAFASVEVTEEDLTTFLDVCHLSCQLLEEQSYDVEFDNLAVDVLTKFVLAHNHRLDLFANLDKTA
jgi:hypothetical protein